MVKKEHWQDPRFQQACIHATRLANIAGEEQRIFLSYGQFCVRPASAPYDGEHLCMVHQTHFKDDILERGV